MTQKHLRIALTGSIGMGKSTVLGFFKDEGLPTWDADAAVARLYGPGAAGSMAIADLAPECVTEEGVDRACLSKMLAQDKSLLKRLEAHIHPLVAADRNAFSQSVTEWAAVYDIPLLFETEADAGYDVIVVVSASPKVQRRRVLERAGMSEEKFEFILSRQLPDAEKRARADVVIDTEQSMEHTSQSVRQLVQKWKSEHA